MVRVRINDVAAPARGVRGLFGELDGRAQATAVASAGTAEAFSHVGGRFVALGAETTNPLIAAVHTAFAEHLPLELSPDVVFNTILQGVAAHVATDPKRFRAVFVAHRGRKALDVRDDSLVRGDWGARWDRSIRSLGAQVRETMSGGSARAVLGTAFTTTTLAEATAHAAVFMDAVKHYYTYTVHTFCGIPWVDVAGTREDWERLARAVEPLLLQLGLDAWNRELQIILSYFCRAFDGAVAAGEDRAHWNSMYNHFGPQGSGGVAKVSGWIAKLFLYIRGGMNPLLLPSPPRAPCAPAAAAAAAASITQPKPELAATPWLDHDLWGRLLLLPTEGPRKEAPERAVKLCDFPAGVTTTPFTWMYLGTQIPMSLIAGLVGVMAAQSGALKPEVGWIVAGSAA
jgi:hypothetical protein